MGPRQDAGEDKGQEFLFSMISVSFNGAPAGCRGRPDEYRAAISEQARLQWGPGRMPGKTCKHIPCMAGAPMLQWGPGRMPGKTGWVYDATLLEMEASMGPRQDAGED